MMRYEKKYKDLLLQDLCIEHPGRLRVMDDLRGELNALVNEGLAEKMESCGIVLAKATKSGVEKNRESTAPPNEQHEGPR